MSDNTSKSTFTTPIPGLTTPGATGPGGEPTQQLLAQAAELIKPIDPSDPHWPIARPAADNPNRMGR